MGLDDITPEGPSDKNGDNPKESGLEPIGTDQGNAFSPEKGSPSYWDEVWEKEGPERLSQLDSSHIEAMSSYAAVAPWFLKEKLYDEGFIQLKDVENDNEEVTMDLSTVEEFYDEDIHGQI